MKIPALCIGPTESGKITMIIDLDRASEADWQRLYDAIESGGTLVPGTPKVSSDALLRSLMGGWWD